MWLGSDEHATSMTFPKPQSIHLNPKQRLVIQQLLLLLVACLSDPCHIFFFHSRACHIEKDSSAGCRRFAMGALRLDLSFPVTVCTILSPPERAVAALQKRSDGCLDVRVGMLPARLALVDCHAHLLPQHGRAIHRQSLTQLREPPHEADHSSPHCESVHAKVQCARLAAGVDCQAEVALPAGCLEDLQQQQTMANTFLGRAAELKHACKG